MGFFFGCGYYARSFVYRSWLYTKSDTFLPLPIERRKYSYTLYMIIVQDV